MSRREEGATRPADADKTVGQAEGTVRRRRSSAEVADRILEAAAEEFEAAGYTGATTAAIARRAEVTEAQIFRLHASKQDLFRAAIFTPLNRHFAAFDARSKAMAAELPGEDVARAYIGELLDFISAHSRMFLSLAVASAYNPDASDGMGEMEGLKAYFARGQAMMENRVKDGARVRPELMVRVSFGAVLASLMFRDWLFPAGLASEEDLRDAIATFVIEGIEANGPIR